VPRSPRIELPNGLYHVNAGAVDGRQLIRDELDWTMFLSLLEEAAGRGWLIHAYCALYTHYHLALTTPSADLSEGMWRINIRYARWFNARYGLRGHVFSDRYDARLVRDESHALEVSRYVPLQPVAAGICRKPEDWPWSSYRALLGLAPMPPFLRPARLLDMFGQGSLALRLFRRFVEDGQARLAQVPGTRGDANTRYLRTGRPAAQRAG
jgi:REP element-mobilizing transposase RayT